VRVPETKYARAADGLRLAYQQWGEGPRVMVVPALLSNMDVAWEHEYIMRVHDFLGRHLTVAAFDKRGMGLSDRPDSAPTLEERTGDIVAVMDALGWETASLMGVSEGGVMSQLFAASSPERVDRLVLHNTIAPRRYWERIPALIADGDRPVVSEQEVKARFDQLADGWPENAHEFVEWIMPDQTDNESFVRWVGRYQRLSASPRDFRRQVESIFTIDADDAPERITCPTLVMHVRGDRVLPVVFGRILAEVIPDAGYIEIAGDDHFSWALPNWRDIADPFVEFIAGTSVARVASRRFATVLFTDIVDSTRQAANLGDAAWREVLDGHDRVARKLVDHHGGHVVKSTGDGLLVVFDAPSSAVECGTALCCELGDVGVQIRAGAHAGEIELHDDGDISGFAVNLAARVEQNAADGQLWVSSTLHDMLLGGTTTFADRGEHRLKGTDGTWRLFAVCP
jgi:class 3 adenylate cyclase